MTECSGFTDILHNVYILDIRYILNYMKYSHMYSIHIKVGNNIYIYININIYIYIYIIYIYVYIYIYQFIPLLT